VSLEQPIGDGAGKIVERAAGLGFHRPEIERVEVVADLPEQVGAERVKPEIEGDLEIAGQMRSRDLEAVRLEILDQHLAEAAFLAERLLGRETRA
jgi:hypothetical protein